jgi:hypothetical protein
MANPHIGTARAVQKDIREKGYTPKKGRLVQGALKRAHHHRESNRGGR